MKMWCPHCKDQREVKENGDGDKTCTICSRLVYAEPVEGQPVQITMRVEARTVSQLVQVLAVVKGQKIGEFLTTLGLNKNAVGTLDTSGMFSLPALIKLQDMAGIEPLQMWALISNQASTHRPQSTVKRAGRPRRDAQDG